LNVSEEGLTIRLPEPMAPTVSVTGTMFVGLVVPAGEKK
jgi:hypothetical protein